MGDERLRVRDVREMADPNYSVGLDGNDESEDRGERQATDCFHRLGPRIVGDWDN